MIYMRFMYKHNFDRFVSCLHKCFRFKGGAKYVHSKDFTRCLNPRCFRLWGLWYAKSEAALLKFATSQLLVTLVAWCFKARIHFSIPFSLFLAGCEQSEPIETTWQQFCCRDRGNPAERLALYRAKVPSNWIREDSDESVLDSRKPICSFRIGDPHDPTHLAIHTFTFDSFDQRIPPAAQIARWKRQFDELDLSTLIIDPQAYGGFTGLSLYACGQIKEKETGVLGYSMQLASQHWMILQNDLENNFKLKQMSADYTLKAVGSPSSIARWKDEIELFANSFELIDEVPTR